MATLQANIVDGDDLQPEPVMANFNEIFTNINENNLAAAASLPSAKLDLSSIAKNISFASGYGVKLNTAFDAALSAEQADLSSGLTVWNTIGLNSAIFDLGSDFDTANNKFVVPTTGLYFLEGKLLFSDLTAEKRYGIRFLLNGTDSLGGELKQVVLTAEPVSCDTSYIGILSASDEITLQAYANVGTDTVDVGSANMRGFYIGPTT